VHKYIHNVTKVMCALFVLQKECRKVWGARYTLGERNRSENTVVFRRFHKLREVTIIFVMSVRPSAWNSAPSGRIFTKFDMVVFWENMSRKFKFHLNLTRITGTLHEDQNLFLIYLAQFFLASHNTNGVVKCVTFRWKICFC